MSRRGSRNRTPPRQQKKVFFEEEGRIRKGQIELDLFLHRPAPVPGTPHAVGAAGLVTKVRAILDTGATATVIHPDVLLRVPLPHIGSGKVNIADGSTPLAQIVLGTIRLDGKDGGCHWLTRRLYVQPGSYEMLLGMDIIAECTFELNGPAGTWRLRRRV